MTVSFCVIGYNEEQTISALFTNIIDQNYPHDQMEIILVDSNSTDKTRELMKRFAKENTSFMRVLVLDNYKKKQAAGWNCAIREALGDIIIRVDAHSSVPCDFVSKNVKCIDKEYVVGGMRPSIAECDTPWQNTLLLSEKSMFGSGIALYRRSYYKRYVKSVFHGAYRKEVFEKAGLFNERLGRTEDNEMHYRIRKSGYKICYDPSIISYQYARNTWLRIIKQKFGNGYWIGLTTGICPECFSLYHFVPLLFVVGLIISVFLCLTGFYLPLSILSLVYIMADIIMSVIAVIGKKKYWHYLLLPVVFLSLHLSYGVGTMVGIVKMPFWRKTITGG